MTVAPRRASLLAAALGVAFACDAGATRAGPAEAVPAATMATTMGEATAPWGWGEFCRKTPEDCGLPGPEPREAKLTPAAWRTLVAVNDLVNTRITPVTDQEHWGVTESWDLPTDGKGDCEDYVLLKRRLLREVGFPRGALLVTVVTDRKGDGHAVLTVRTDRGEFVLDNQAARVLPWAATGYRFVKRQSGDDPNRWVWLGFAGGGTSVTAGRR